MSGQVSDLVISRSIWQCSVRWELADRLATCLNVAFGDAVHTVPGNTTDRILFHNKRALTSREPRLQLCYERCPALCKPSNYPTYGCCVCSSAETIQAYIYAIVMHYSRVVKCRRICRVTACSHLSTNVADTIKTSPTSCRTAGRHFWRSTNHCKRRSATPIRLARARLACFDWQVAHKNFCWRHLSATNVGKCEERIERVNTIHTRCGVTECDIWMMNDAVTLRCLWSWVCHIRQRLSALTVDFSCVCCATARHLMYLWHL